MFGGLDISSSKFFVLSSHTVHIIFWSSASRLTTTDSRLPTTHWYMVHGTVLGTVPTMVPSAEFCDSLNNATRDTR
jgi:hypothetical protein